MAERFSRPPSEYWGIEDPALAFDFDRLHHLRLKMHDAEIARKEAAAIRGETEPEIPSLLKSNEIGQFAQ